MAEKGDQPVFKMVVLKDVMVPMRDGVRLASDISMPSEDGVSLPDRKFPTLVVRTPYDKNLIAQLPKDIVATATHLHPEPTVARGYVVIYQDVRGSSGSQGVFEPALNEAQDGVDMLAWIREQPWSDGRIAIFGPSYHGGVGMATATEAPPGLLTAIVQTPNTDQFTNWIYFDGVLCLRGTSSWAIMQSVDPKANDSEESAKLAQDELFDYAGKTTLGWPFEDTFPAEAYARLVRTLPLREMPIVRHLHWWRDWIDNRDNPSYFAPNSVSERLDRVNVPLLLIGGWYDLFIRNTCEYYEGLVDHAATVKAREGQRLLIGPWSHGTCVDCPPGAAVDGHALQLAWLDQCFNGVDHPLFQHAVTLYIMGENRWRAEESWPLPGTKRTRYYLHSQGGANTASGDGKLSTERPNDERADQFRYDPADPVPTLGGIDASGSRAAQNDAEARSDVLCYTTDELVENVEVTGKVTATLFAASSATDTDWWMRLVDVRPDGRADTLCHGVTRARYRNSRTQPEPLTPGEIVGYTIDMQATSNVFKKGHRIRVEVSSSCFPLSERHPNSFVNLGNATEKDFIVATQTIYHDAEHPSCVELPIIPLERQRCWIDTPFPLAGDRHSDSLT